VNTDTVQSVFGHDVSHLRDISASIIQASGIGLQSPTLSQPLIYIRSTQGT